MIMLKLFFLLTVLTGFLYPHVVTVIGLTLLTDKATGSLVTHQGQVIGSGLLAQKFSQDKFFHSRPSASDFQTIGSAASQNSPTKEDGRKIFAERKERDPLAGMDAWTASGSGLDPHISPQTAYAQMERVAAARSLNQEVLRVAIEKFIERPTFGIWGQPRVNVLKLNLYLEEDIDGNTRRTPAKP